MHHAYHLYTHVWQIPLHQNMFASLTEKLLPLIFKRVFYHAITEREGGKL